MIRRAIAIFFCLIKTSIAEGKGTPCSAGDSAPLSFCLPFEVAGGGLLWLNKAMQERARQARSLSKAINLGSEHLLPWPFLVFFVVP
jgi:hypothetical protein